MNGPDEPTGATTWVEVSRDALRYNFAAVSSFAGVPVCAIVKANAYGHGLVETARVFADAGARMLGVTRWEEARALRVAGITLPVLLLTPAPREILRDAIALDLALCIASVDDVGPVTAAAVDAGRPAHVHLKIDTGMGRLGVSPADALEASRLIADNPVLSLEGVWTHFAKAGTPDGLRQLARFEAIRSALGKHASRAIVHTANSAATIAMPAARYDMVRVGTLLYGLQPPNVRVPFELQDPFSWYARIVNIRTVGAGDTVGYGSEWRAAKPVRVATIAVGYVDGFGLEPAARTESLAEAVKSGARLAAVSLRQRPSPRHVIVRGVRAPVLGRISMQQATISIEDVPGTEVGDIVKVPARRLLVASHVDRIYR